MLTQELTHLSTYDMAPVRHEDTVLLDGGVVDGVKQQCVSDIKLLHKQILPNDKELSDIVLEDEGMGCLVADNGDVT